MRKTLPHKGIVLRSHACLWEMQRNKQECLVLRDQINDLPCNFSVLPITSHSLSPSPPTHSLPAILRLEHWNFKSLCHRITKEQNLRLPGCQTLHEVETACTSEFGRTKVQIPVCCPLAVWLQENHLTSWIPGVLNCKIGAMAMMIKLDNAYTASTAVHMIGIQLPQSLD